MLVGYALLSALALQTLLTDRHMCSDEADRPAHTTSAHMQSGQGPTNRPSLHMQHHQPPRLFPLPSHTHTHTITLPSHTNNTPTLLPQATLSCRASTCQAVASSPPSAAPAPPSHSSLQQRVGACRASRWAATACTCCCCPTASRWQMCMSARQRHLQRLGVVLLVVVVVVEGRRAAVVVRATTQVLALVVLLVAAVALARGVVGLVAIAEPAAAAAGVGRLGSWTPRAV